MQLSHQLASEALLRQRSEIVAALDGRAAPSGEGTDKSGGEASLQVAGDDLPFLAQALALNSRALFTDYVAWAKVVLGRRQVADSALARHLETLAAVLRERLPAELGALAAEFVGAAVQAMPAMPEDLPTFLHEGAPLSPLAHQYFEALRRGERHLASRLVLESVAAGTPVKEIYLNVFQPAQYEIGRLWQTNRITVAQEHYCTAATQLIMSQLYPHIFATAKHGRTLVATCVAGDLHEIGVRMVADFFEMEGWNTFYLGANTPASSVVSTVVERSADVLAISATISHHTEAVRDLIQAVRNHPGTRHVKILVGGFPFNRDADLWRKIGADGSARDAQRAITLADQIVRETKP